MSHVMSYMGPAVPGNCCRRQDIPGLCQPCSSIDGLKFYRRHYYWHAVSALSVRQYVNIVNDDRKSGDTQGQWLPPTSSAITVAMQVCLRVSWAASAAPAVDDKARGTCSASPVLATRLSANVSAAREFTHAPKRPFTVRICLLMYISVIGTH